MIINIETKKITYDIYRGEILTASVTLTDKRGVSGWYQLNHLCDKRWPEFWLHDSQRTRERFSRRYLKTTNHIAHVPKELVSDLTDFERTQLFISDREWEIMCDEYREVAALRKRNEAILNNPLNKLILKAIRFWKRIIK